MRLQTLAPPRRLIEELPPTQPPVQPQDAAFVGRGLAETLAAPPSTSAVAVAQQMCAAANARLASEAAQRTALNSRLNERRCSFRPLLGRDAIEALTITRCAA